MSSIFSALRLSHDAAYYSTNGAFIVSYLLVRYAQPDSPVQRPSQYLAAGTTELDIGLAAVLLGFQKWRSSTSNIEFVDTAILYAELTVVTFVFLTDPIAAVWYTVVLCVVWTVVRRNPVELPDAVLDMSPFDLQLATEKDGADRWVVLVGKRRADYLINDFAALATSAHSKGTRFAYMDLCRWPETAAPLGIDVGLLSMQVPSVLLLEPGNASPTKRLPYLEDGEAKNVRLDRRAIEIFFNIS